MEMEELEVVLITATASGKRGFVVGYLMLMMTMMMMEENLFLFLFYDINNLFEKMDRLGRRAFALLSVSFLP